MHSQYQPVVERESSSLSSKSENTRLLGGILTTPIQAEKVYHDKNVSSIGDIPCRPNVMKEMNHRLGYKNTLDVFFNLRQTPYVEINLIDLDDPVDSEATYANPEEVYLEIEILKRRVVREDAKFIHLEKEKEKDTINSLIERDNLLRRMVALKEHNRKLEENFYSEFRCFW